MDKSPDWHPADIQAALKKRGLSLSGLSISHGYHPTAVGKALTRSWPKMELIIAAALDEAPQTIWPSRYLSQRAAMIQESPDVIESEAIEVYPHAEAADQHVDVHQHEWHDDAARPVRYLWPALMAKQLISLVVILAGRRLRATQRG